MNFLPGFFSIIFNKEYIVANDELIIYLTFLTLLIVIVNSSKNALENIFTNLRNYEKNTLQENSTAQHLTLNNSIAIAEIFSYADLDINLPEPDEFTKI